MSASSGKKERHALTILIIGLPGAGKTTLGKFLEGMLKLVDVPVQFASDEDTRSVPFEQADQSIALKVLRRTSITIQTACTTKDGIWPAHLAQLQRRIRNQEE